MPDETKLRIFNNKGMTALEFIKAVENFSYTGPTIRLRSATPTQDAVLAGERDDLRRLSYHVREQGFEAHLIPQDPS